MESPRPRAAIRDRQVSAALAADPDTKTQYRLLNDHKTTDSVFSESSSQGSIEWFCKNQIDTIKMTFWSSMIQRTADNTRAIKQSKKPDRAIKRSGKIWVKCPADDGCLHKGGPCIKQLSRSALCFIAVVRKDWAWLICSTYRRPRVAVCSLIKTIHRCLLSLSDGFQKVLVRSIVTCRLTCR